MKLHRDLLSRLSGIVTPALRLYPPIPIDFRFAPKKKEKRGRRFAYHAAVDQMDVAFATHTWSRRGIRSVDLTTCISETISLGENARECRPDIWKRHRLSRYRMGLPAVPLTASTLPDRKIYPCSPASRHGPHLRPRRGFPIDGSFLPCHPHPPGVPESLLSAWSSDVPCRQEKQDLSIVLKSAGAC